MSLLMRRDVGPEILGADRRPDFLHDLAAAVLEGLLEAAERFVAEGIIGGDGADPLVALLAGPLPERMGGLRRHEGRAHHVGIFLEVALAEIVGGRDRADVEHLLARRDRRQCIARRRQHAADQHVNLVRQDELVGLGDAGVRLALVVFDDQGHLGAAELAVVLVQIHLEAVLHVGAELREDAGLRRDEADAQFFRRRVERRADQKTGKARGVWCKFLGLWSWPSGLAFFCCGVVGRACGHDTIAGIGDVVVDDERKSFGGPFPQRAAAQPSGLTPPRPNLRQPLRHVDHHVMPARHLIGAPRRVGLDPRHRLVEARVGVVQRADITFLGDALAGAAERHLVEECRDRLRHAHRVDPGAVRLVDVERRGRARRDADLALGLRGAQQIQSRGAGQVGDRFAVVRHEGVEEHDRADLPRPSARRRPTPPCRRRSARTAPRRRGLPISSG